MLSSLRMDLIRTWGDDNIPSSYKTFLKTLANAVPNLGAIRLSSATESAERSTISQGLSVYQYCSEVIVGSGASAIVYRALHQYTGEAVAIKRYTKSFSEIPWDEINILRKLNHKNIITFYEFNIRNGLDPELIMEFASLGSMIDQIRVRKFTVSEARATIKQTLVALQYIHGEGISHRDVKPGNILIMARDPIHAKLADFGLSSKADEHSTVCGTKRYAAPEIFRSSYTAKISYTAKVDIWSVGVIVMELWGNLPADTHASWAEALVAHKLKQKRNITTALLDLCLQLDPNDRATAEGCLQLSFFDSQVDADRNQTLLDHDPRTGVDTTVVRPDSSIPDTEPCNDDPRTGVDTTVVRPDSSIPDTAPCNDDPRTGVDTTVVRPDSSIPDTAPCNIQGIDLGWNSSELRSFLRRAEALPVLSSPPLPPFEDIPTWNPIVAEDWIPGLGNFPQNTASHVTGAAPESESERSQQDADAHGGTVEPSPDRGVANQAAANTTQASPGTANQTE
ncbi:hypothetical protein V2A60_002206 [Cordyceps javanica]